MKPALLIVRNICHNSQSLGSLRSCRIYIINRSTQAYHLDLPQSPDYGKVPLNCSRIPDMSCGIFLIEGVEKVWAYPECKVRVSTIIPNLWLYVQ